MSLAYAIDHVVTTTESVSVEVAAKSEMTLVSTDVDPKTSEVVSTYVLASGDAMFPAYVTFRAVLQNRATGSIRRVTINLSTWATETDSVTGIVKRKPLNGSIAINIPADLTIELADLMQFVGNLFSFSYPSVSSGTRSTSYLQKLLYGVPQVV